MDDGPSRHEHEDLSDRVGRIERRLDDYERWTREELLPTLNTVNSRLAWLVGAASVAGSGLVLLAGALIYHATHGG